MFKHAETRSVASRSNSSPGCELIATHLPEWSQLKRLPVIRVQKSITMPLAVWIRSIPSFRCQVVCQCSHGGEKLGDNAALFAPSSSFSRGPGYCDIWRISQKNKNCRESTNELSAKTIGSSVVASSGIDDGDLSIYMGQRLSPWISSWLPGLLVWRNHHWPPTT